MFGLFKKKTEAPWVSAVILAAGSSVRMGGVDKLMQEIDGAPVLVHTLRAYEASDIIREIILVVRGEAFVEYTGLATDYGISKLTQVVKGGASRLESAYIGVGACDRQSRYIAVHDGARPCVTVQEIEEVCSAAFRSTCALAAMPIVDTVKRAEKDHVAETLDRSVLFAAACPQVADSALMYAALKSALDNNPGVTDESMAWEAIGARPALVACSKSNIKVTLPEDLVMASVILSQRGY